MTKYQEIISKLQNIDASKAEYLEEEINIIVHKLKFLTSDNLPKTLLLEWNTNFESLDSVTLQEKIKLAGGNFINSITQNPDCIIFIQNSPDLYTALPEFLNVETVQKSAAFQHNKIFIIQDSNFNKGDESFLQDIEILAEILQSKYFFYGHEGISWVKFDIH